MHGASSRFPADVGVHTLFTAVAAAHPHRIAVDEAGRTVSYTALKQQADAVAAALQDAGVQCGQFVALVADRSLYEEAERDYVAFWARQARELVSWFSDFDTTLEWDLPFAKWFSGGTLNISYNCLDRHLAAGLGDRIAYYWEGEPGDTRILTYRDLHREVCKFANVLKSLGLRTGDRVAIYMPMVPELPVAMLACTRIGVAHSVIFGGFSPDAISDRCNDAEARLIITADAGYRRGAPSLLKPNVDTALASTTTVEHVVVVNRCNTLSPWSPARLWWPA